MSLHISVFTINGNNTKRRSARACRGAAFFLAFVFPIIVTTAGAETIEHMSIRSVGRVAYQHLFDAISDQGESLNAFVLRVAPDFRAYSDKTGFEACAVIAKSETENKWSVVVGTSRSHIACVNDPARVQNGMVSIRQTIHSHGKNASFSTNESDKTLVPSMSTKNRIMGQNIYQFSETDFNDLPGFLATPDGVLYQNGPGTTTHVVP